MKRFFARLFGKKQPEQVPYHDFATGQTVMIPKTELSSGAMLVRIEGQKQPVYVDITQLKPGGYQHPSFEGETRAAIETLVVDLADVYPLTYEQWEDGFRRDRNYAREIAAWLHVAAILKVMSKNHGFTPDKKKECYSILVTCLLGARDTVRNRFQPKLLSEAQVEQTVKYFYEGGFS